MPSTQYITANKNTIFNSAESRGAPASSDPDVETCSQGYIEDKESIMEIAKSLSFQEQLKKLKFTETPDLDDRKVWAEIVIDSLNDGILAGYKERAERKDEIMRDGKLKDVVFPDPNIFQYEQYFVEGEVYGMIASSVSVCTYELNCYKLYIVTF